MLANPFNPSPQDPFPLIDHGVIHSFRDEDFDRIYSEPVRDLSVIHWSPVNVCRLAAKLLVAEPGTRVLDIGCGPGKFCAIGAATTRGHFTGIEQRGRLARTARELIKRYGISRVEIVHGNIVDVSFREFDAFYLFNPFAENVLPSLRIDFEVDLGREIYARYVDHVGQQLDLMPQGTRVVTYCGDCAEIPEDYACEKKAFGDKLKLWVKGQAPLAIRGVAADWMKDAQVIGRGPCGLAPA